MKKEFRLFGGVALGVLVGISASSSFAQERQPPPDRDVLIEHQRIMQGPESPHPAMPPHGDFVFFASEMSFDGKLVKGAPYSAQAVTESTQTLSDGNRIVNKSTAAVHRDSEGRTRREQTLRAIGPFANGGEPPQTIFISDPVSGISYALDPRAHVARKMPPLRFKLQIETPPPPGAKPTGPPEGLPPHRVEFERYVSAGKIAPEGGVVMEWHGSREGKAKTESLGKQIIEGVEVDGTRSTVTIPAGEIGNERSIEIVSERWYSSELQIVVMSRHSDPRSGETVYRLTNIDRSEPARSLFEVPADYTLKEDPMPQKMRIRKPGSEQ